MDEDDVRSRANPRGTRPRSKQRPATTTPSTAWSSPVDRGRYAVLVGDVEVTAMRARELGRKGIVVGDRVGVVGEVSDAPDALARIVRARRARRRCCGAPPTTTTRTSASSSPTPTSW